MFAFLRKKVGNYTLLESLSVALLVAIAFWISSELFQVRQQQEVLRQNASKTAPDQIRQTIANN